MTIRRLHTAPSQAHLGQRVSDILFGTPESRADLAQQRSAPLLKLVQPQPLMPPPGSPRFAPSSPLSNGPRIGGGTWASVLIGLGMMALFPKLEEWLRIPPTGDFRPTPEEGIGPLLERLRKEAELALTIANIEIELRLLIENGQGDGGLARTLRQKLAEAGAELQNANADAPGRPSIVNSTANSTAVDSPNGGATAPPPTDQDPSSSDASKKPTNFQLAMDHVLNRMAKAPIAMSNVNLSFGLAAGVRCLLEKSSPVLEYVAPFLFTSTPYDQPKLFDEWINCNIFGVFGMWMFLGKTFWSANAIFHKPDTSNMPPWKIYVTEFWLRGLIGLNAVIGIRQPQQVKIIQTVKNFLTSKPLTRAVEALFSSASRRNPLIRIAGIGDYFLGFFGKVTPSQKGLFVGFAADIFGNSVLDVVNAFILSSPKTIPQILLPGLVISSLVGYANTNITQYQHFDFSQKYIRRVILGILKSGVYRGICVSAAVASGLNYTLQIGYGLAAMTYSGWATRNKTPQ